MYSDEELIRSYLISMDESLLSTYPPFMELDFERDSLNLIMGEVKNLYYEVARISKVVITEGLSDDEFTRYNRLHELLDRLLNYEPLFSLLSEVLSNNNVSLK